MAQRGFSLIELIVTLSLIGILLGLALPSFNAWSRNAKARSTADALQTGLRLAQNEAIRRNRQVVFSLTNASPSLTAAAAANGSNWVIRTVPGPGELHEFVEGGSLGGLGANIAVTGASASVCFNSFGRLVANSAPGASQTGGAAISAGSCALPAAGTLVTYDFALPNPATGDRRYRVTLALGGQLRLCDRDRSLASSPEGCT